MRKITSIACILFNVVVLSACTKVIPNSSLSTTKPGILYISPTNLFEGDGAKFQAFLGPMSGAVKLHYTGQKREIKAVQEIWENGNNTQTLSSMGTLVDPNGNQGKFDGEFAVSIKEETDEDKSSHYLVSCAFINDAGAIPVLFLKWSNHRRTMGLPRCS